MQHGATKNRAGPAHTSPYAGSLEQYMVAMVNDRADNDDSLRGVTVRFSGWLADRSDRPYDLNPNPFASTERLPKSVRNRNRIVCVSLLVQLFGTEFFRRARRHRACQPASTFITGLLFFINIL